MDLTFTGRGLGLTDAVRATAEHKLAAISRLEPRATRIDLLIAGSLESSSKNRITSQQGHCRE